MRVNFAKCMLCRNSDLVDVAAQTVKTKHTDTARNKMNQESTEFVSYV